MRPEDWKNMPMPVRTIIAIASDRELPGTAINLGTYFAQNANEQGEVIVSFRGLAKQFDTGLSTIQKSVAALEQRGHITKRTTGGRGGTVPTVFRIIPPDASN
jgi:hypothetical protein